MFEPMLAGVGASNDRIQWVGDGPGEHLTVRNHTARAVTDYFTHLARAIAAVPSSGRKTSKNSRHRRESLRQWAKDRYADSPSFRRVLLDRELGTDLDDATSEEVGRL